MTSKLKFHLLFALSAVLLWLPPASFAAFPLSDDHPNALARQVKMYFAGPEAAPATARGLPDWLSQRKPTDAISLFGGGYWLYADVTNPTQNSEWVIDPDGRLIERADIYVYGAGPSRQILHTGYRASHDYPLHYGKQLSLPPGTRAQILMRIESPYYAAVPRLVITAEPTYRHQVLRDDVLILLSLGALLTLALYNLFIYSIHSDRAHFHYAVYLVAYFAGWALTFQLPAELFGWHDLRVHYIPFFLLPVLNTLFYMEFLQLKANFPRLAALSRINIVLPLLLLPSCFIALSYAHTLATIVISLWLLIALVCGFASLRSGFRPARYFVLAFTALLIPGLIILPANVGLIPSPVSNPELLTLLGGTLDAILLAFALADKIRYLTIEKDQALERYHGMLQLARTDHLTGIPNRHAFELDFATWLQDKGAHELMLFLIDLDGLKAINDVYGHMRGDQLICQFSSLLVGLASDDVAIYRVGGDEFTILAPNRHEPRLRNGLKQIEAQLHANGFVETGISYGVSFGSNGQSLHEMYIQADRLMYQHKTSRRGARSQDGEARDALAPSPPMPAVG